MLAQALSCDCGCPQAFQELELRENELGLIRDGAKSPQKKPKISKQTKREAMENYLKIIYNRERVQVRFSLAMISII